MGCIPLFGLGMLGVDSVLWHVSSFNWPAESLNHSCDVFDLNVDGRCHTTDTWSDTDFLKAILHIAASKISKSLITPITFFLKKIKLLFDPHISDHDHKWNPNF